MDHLETIRMFVKVAETSSFSRTAEHFAVTTAVVTRRVVALEKRLDARLFQRTTRHVALTDAGATFLESARRILDDIEEAEMTVAGQQRRAGGVLRIASPVAFGLRHLSPMLKCFSDAYPLVTPHIVLSDDPINLVEQRFDAVIVPEGEAGGNTVVLRRFASSPLQLVTSPEYLQRRGVPGSVAALNDHAFLLHSGKHFAQCQRMLERAGDCRFHPQSQIVSNSLAMLHRLSVDGHGIAALPAYLAGPDIDSGLLVNILAAVDMPRLNLYVGFESRHNMPARIRVFVDFIVDHFSIDDITQVSDPHPMIVRRAAAATCGARALHHAFDAVSAPLND
jgi:DNA-binding transcriptional LysR family regulator